MNRYLNTSLIVLAAIFSTASMCNDDDDKNENTDDTAFETSISQGTWTVTYFFDKEDETSDFDGYSFKFNDDGNATATKSSLSVPGSWDTEESSDGNTKLYLDFGTASPLDELNEDWIVVEFSSAKVTLEHVSGGDGETDSAILEKN